MPRKVLPNVIRDLSEPAVEESVGPIAEAPAAVEIPEISARERMSHLPAEDDTARSRSTIA